MSNLTRSNPFEDFFGDLGKGFWVKPLAVPGGDELKLKVDVTEDDKAFTVHAEIPGVKKEDIQVEVNGDQVSIRAEVKREKEEKKGEKVIHSERYYGMVGRSFSLPGEVDDKATVAKYKDGVLDLTLPKKSGNGSRRISVQ
ncbi:MAG: Hsp20 family protein [Betaproteobacteria bacterium]|nr:Hsp20 family protein [Betaproteobacteria bacterium]